MPPETLTQSGARVVDPVLTEVAQGFRHPDRIGEIIFPRVTVTASGGQIIQFGKESFRKRDYSRAPGANAKQVDFGYQGDKYALVNKSADAKVPREWQRDASRVPGIDLGSRAVEVTMRALELELEIEQAELALDATQYAAANKVTLSGTDQWSDTSGSDPITQIDDYRDTVAGRVGIRPNVLELGRKAWRLLKNHPKVTDRFKHTTSAALTEELIAALLQLDRIVVGRAVYADDNDNFQDVWDPNTGLLTYSNLAPLGREEPSYGYSYTMDGHPLVVVPEWNRDARSWMYGMDYERAPVIASADSGFLIQSIGA